MGRIDMHAHFIPDFYRAAASAAGHSHPDGMPAIPAWSVDAALATMDGLDIATALLSISSPGVHFGDDVPARALARTVNRFGAGLVADHPDRFAVLASLPLPDVAGAIDEIAFSYDELGLDGVVLESNAAGVYPGDPVFEPVWDALDERSALVVLHPTSPPGWELVARGRPRPMLEFPIDTARAVSDLLLSGTLQRHPRVTVVVPHGGGVLASVADRIATFAAAQGVDVRAQLRRLYFDLAGMPLPHQLPSLLALAGPDRLLYGSDWPFTPEQLVKQLAGALDSTPLLDAEAQRTNATRLLPRLTRR
ncbi:putative TIM-barrel fold metal-dependent hydrolase [Actinoplanes tereljensis]|uniref:6-methylsalicylate decarboxylase n=1 Tax=Paractinoplanes tereljensis TaxID=571912 RepID=A0A919NRV1_9ACTN|nr:amidohydrolase family protein [Actinoplanes tereljensis]GIF23173.1 amidohydrolase [Actinoplanes tereljensis]